MGWDLGEGVVDIIEGGMGVLPLGPVADGGDLQRGKTHQRE